MKRIALRPRAWLIIVAVGVLASLVWILRPKPAHAIQGQHLTSESHPTTTSSPSTSSVEPRHTGADPSVRREERATGPAVLSVRIVDTKGRPLSGWLYWITSGSAPNSACTLAPESIGPMPEKANRLSLDGTAELGIPPGHWTWLRAASGRSVRMDAYERVAPFSGRKELEITLSPTRKGLHVFLLGGDLTKPAVGQDVAVYHNDIRSADMPRLLVNKTTDAYGYASFRDLPPGAFLLCAPGTRPGDPPPHTARLILPEGMPVSEMPVTLVVPEQRYLVRFRVHARMHGQRILPPPLLFLRRIGPLQGQLLPLRQTLKEGDQEQRLTVPAGQYEIGVQPLGCMRFVSSPGVLEVGKEKETTVQIALELNPVETEVELLGLDRDDFPVTVYPRAVDQLLDGNHDLYFFGPYRWRRARQKVRAPTGLAHLVVSGRNRFWISKRPVQLAGGSAAVDLLPATRITVHWFAPPSVRRLQMLELSTNLGRVHMLLRPQLVRASGVDRRALAGTVVVPRGQVRLGCTPTDGGATVWKRVIDAEGPLHTLIDND